MRYPIHRSLFLWLGFLGAFFVLSEWWYSDHGYDDLLTAGDNPARLLYVTSHQGGVEIRLHWPQTKHPYRWVAPFAGRIIAPVRSEKDSQLVPPYYEREHKDMLAVGTNPTMRFDIIQIGIPYRLIMAGYLAVWAAVVFLLRARWHRKVTALAAEVTDPQSTEVSS